MPDKNSVDALNRAGARARLKEAHLYLSAAELLNSGSSAENKVAGSNAILAGSAAADAISANEAADLIRWARNLVEDGDAKTR